MTRRDGWLGAADGTRLYWQAWEPDAEPRDTVILVHGAAEHGGRYGHVAERLVREGYVVYALDHRGHGRSNGARAMIDRLDQLVEDLGLFVARVGGRPYLVGHSMGGAVALTYAIRHGDTISGLVVSGPAVATDAVPAPLKAITALLSKVAPKLPVFKIEEDAVSRDPHVVRDYKSDPLNHPGKLPARTLGEIVRGMDFIQRDAVALRVPLLLLHGGEDRLCPPEGSRAIHAAAGSADKTLKIYDGLYHEVFNEPERDQVLDDVVDWLAARSTPPVRSAEAAAG